MRQAVIEVYQFSELSESAKEKAREWYRQGAFDYPWWEFVYESAKDAAKLMGIDIEDIFFSGFWSQGDGACFVGSYQYRKGAAADIRKEFPTDTGLQRIAEDLQDAQRRAFYSLEASIRHRGRHSHAYSMAIEVQRADDKEMSDDLEDAIASALRDFADWIYQRLEEEFDWLNADEQVDDAIIANGYEFTEDGEVY